MDTIVAMNSDTCDGQLTFSLVHGYKGYSEGLINFSCCDSILAITLCVRCHVAHSSPYCSFILLSTIIS